jgi:hypothetical protein
MFGVALAAATWGLLLRSPVSAAAVPGIAVVVLALVLVNYQGKPSGLGAFLGVESEYGVPVRSIWGSDRLDWVAVLRGDRDEEAVIRYVEHHVPADTTIAIAARFNDFLYPYFGSRLKRRVALLRPMSNVPAAAEWLVLSPGARVRRCAEAWQRALELESGWRIERRVRLDECETLLVSTGPG